MTEFQLQPMPQVVFRLDRAGVVLDFENALAGSSLRKMRFRRGTHVHRCLHVRCTVDDCRFNEMLHAGLWQIEKARILEWEHQLRPSDVTLRLHMRHAHRRAKTWATLTVTDITEARRWSGTMREAHDALSGLMARSAAERASLAITVDRKLQHLSGELIIAQEIERRRIASELHDGLGQWLSMAKLSIENGLTRPGTAASAVDYTIAMDHITHAIREVRAIAQNLRPSPLTEFGLVPTMELLCHAMQQTQPQLDLKFEVRGESVSMRPAQAVAMTRILQQALNNLAKHSQATRAVVAVAFTAKSSKLTVSDNGSGFDVLGLAAAGTTVGYGLTSMRNRMEQSNGRLQIRSYLGRGTTVTAIWESVSAGD